jgi:C-methyltransferase C-terminal domain
MLGFAIKGLDPTYEGSNPAVIKEYFTPQVGLQADGIILRHVLEHIQNPVQFLQNICEANGGKGKIYIEVPCFDWICNHCAWFDIYYEHVNYFRLADFHRMFELVYDSGHMFGDKFLYVVADLATFKNPTKKSFAPVEYYAGELSKTKSKTAIWGGASKGVIFSLLLERAGAKVDIVVDINPAKQGKYIAGTGILIHSYAQSIDIIPDGSNVFVMNSNYLSEINDTVDGRLHLIAID